jgi:hypothetical protein
MAIDPGLYEKYSGRKGDPYTRLGEVLAKNVKAQHGRDEMAKGVSGGLNRMRMPGIWAQIIDWFKDRQRYKGD